MAIDGGIKDLERERHNFRRIDRKDCSSCRFLREQETQEGYDDFISYTCEHGLITISDNWRDIAPNNDTRDDRCFEIYHYVCDLFKTTEDGN